MTTKKISITKEELVELGKRYVAGESIEALGKEVGIHPKTLRNRINELGIVRRKKVEQELIQKLGQRWIDGEDLETLAKSIGLSIHTLRSYFSILGFCKEKSLRSSKTIGEQVEDDVRTSQLRTEVKYWKGMYQEAVSTRSLENLVVDTIKGVASIIPKIQVPLPAKQEALMEPHPRGVEVDVLQISDLHAGEIVRAEETMGLNSFDMTILNRRLGLLTRKVVELVEIRRSALYIPRLTVAILGDLLAGEIHEELVRTNVAHQMTLAVRVAFFLSQMVAVFSQVFEQVDVHGVIGNHSRLRQKPYSKERYINWDYMCYQWMAVLCANLQNVTFDIPQSPYCMFKVESTSILAFHGDQIRSWMGIPFYGIQRAVYRLREMLQAKKENFDVVLLGHFHCRADLEQITGPIIINGNVKGGDEWSIGSLQSTTRPSQNLLFFHSRNGYIGGQPIYLWEADKKKEYEFKDLLPATWIELQKEIC